MLAKVKIFVLGRPGSGKTTASRRMVRHIEQQNQGWSVTVFNDFEILYKMYQADTEHKKFRPASYGGFDVLDPIVLDRALRELERKVQGRLSLALQECIVIEFARDDYARALRLFNPEILRNAHLLYIDADISICIERIRRRVAYAATADDHFLSEEVLHGYYGRQYMPSNLPEIERVTSINNNDSWQAFIKEIDQFIDDIFNELAFI